MWGKEELKKKILNRGVEEIIEKESLAKKLDSGEKLRIKFGIDPTKPDIHLGHTVPLLKLREFQELGHKAILIIGDFTAQIGDPSGQSAERAALSEKEVRSNMKHYLDQAGKIIDIRKTEVRYNSEWHKKSLKNFLEVTKAVTVSQIMKREDFQRRIDAGQDVTVLESLYAILQGYDSVMVKADVELGGYDQKLNLLMGRRIQRYFKMPEQDIITMPLIEGTDGIRKMSKSFGNYIGINEAPADVFGKIMSIPDSLIAKYFTHFTEVELPNSSPYESKMLLGETLIRMYHNERAALKAKEDWIKTFSKSKQFKSADLQASMTVGSSTETSLAVPFKIKGGPQSITDLLLITNSIGSKSEARRLIEQGAVKINSETKKNPQEILNLRGGEILKIGKHRFFKLEKE